MIDILHEYILAKNKLPLQGIGYLSIEREPSRYEVGNRQFTPPGSNYLFRADAVLATDDLILWLMARMGLEAVEVKQRYSSFCSDLQASIAVQEQVSWKGWGTWQKDTQGALQFLAPSGLSEGSPIAAHKIIRSDSGHSVRVGEDTVDSSEMMQRLSPVKRSLRWESLLYWSWLLLVMSWMGWQLYAGKLNVSSFANPSQIKPVEASNSYKEL